MEKRPRALVRCVAKPAPLRVVVKGVSPAGGKLPKRKPNTGRGKKGKTGKRPPRVLRVTAAAAGLTVVGLAFGLFAPLTDAAVAQAAPIDLAPLIAVPVDTLPQPPVVMDVPEESVLISDAMDPMTMEVSMGALSDQQTCEAPTKTNGTGVAWNRNPVTAFQKANRDGKLVFLLHLSGNFDTPDET